MKVKIGDKVYDPEEEPICILLTDTDKKNIANMASWANKYLVFPDGAFNSNAEAEEFMDDPRLK